MKAAACLLVLALLAAGCGGGDRLSKSQYEEKLQSVLAGAGTGPRVSLDAPVESLASVASTFSGVASGLSHVRAPADAQALNDRLVAGAARAAAALNALVKRVQRLPTAKRDQELAEFDAAHIPGLSEFNIAARGLAAKGYRFTKTAGT